LEKLNKPDSTKDMGILHGIRLVSMLIVILGHRFLSSCGGPTFNPEIIEKVRAVMFFLFFFFVCRTVDQVVSRSQM
jgi:hypothetical protein